jgi:hypothetical protein
MDEPLSDRGFLLVLAVPIVLVVLFLTVLFVAGANKKDRAAGRPPRRLRNLVLGVASAVAFVGASVLVRFLFSRH